MCNVQASELYLKLNGFWDGARRVKRDDFLHCLPEAVTFGASPEMMARLLSRQGLRQPTLASIRKSNVFTALASQYPVSPAVEPSVLERSLAAHSVVGMHGDARAKMHRETELERTCGDGCRID